MGCSPWTPFQGKREDAPIGIVDRGECTFLLKIMNAQKANLKGLIIVNTEDYVLSMGFHEEALSKFQEQNSDIIKMVFAASSFGEFLKTRNEESRQSHILVTNYSQSIYDPVMFVAILVSTLLVGVGAWYSSDAERAKMYYSSTSSRLEGGALRRRQDSEEIDAAAAWSFVFAASCGLLVMYFFVDYIFYGVLFVFCCGATNGLSIMFSHFADFWAPSLQNRHFSVGPSRCSLSFSASDFIGFVPAAIVSANWLVFRLSDWGWILQNVMCVGLLLALQRSVRISNMQIAAILLTTAFLYDIFWVFLSPLFFESSPMIKVATYQHSQDSRDTLPVVLKFPRIDDPFHHPMVLGLGDIALPGLFVSYLLRFDYLSRVGMSWKRGYFVPALLGYLVGMAMTDCNLILMASGQPALLFLVPCTLGTTCALAYCRGDFKALWAGFSRKQKVDTPLTMKSADYATESRQPLVSASGTSFSE